MIKIISFLVAFVFLLNPVFADTVRPAQRAFQIAMQHSHLKSLFAKLLTEAQSIEDPVLRKNAESMLLHPEFQVIRKRKSEETSILSKLKKEKFVSDSSVDFFPNGEPLEFIGAPGSIWLGHHSYPGGLVYHTLTNLLLGLGYSKTYADMYGISLKQDWIRFAAIWHDAAKTVTIPWNSDGSCAKQEAQIANTSAHHIFGIAEALCRKIPTELVLAVASAHSPPMPGPMLKELVGYLKAGSIIAGTSYPFAGLTDDGESLKVKAPIEAFVTHLDDHDYVLTETTVKSVDSKTQERDFWKRNEALSKMGDLGKY